MIDIHTDLGFHESTEWTTDSDQQRLYICGECLSISDKVKFDQYTRGPYGYCSYCSNSINWIGAFGRWSPTHQRFLNLRVDSTEDAEKFFKKEKEMKAAEAKKEDVVEEAFSAKERFVQRIDEIAQKKGVENVLEKEWLFDPSTYSTKENNRIPALNFIDEDESGFEQNNSIQRMLDKENAEYQADVAEAKGGLELGSFYRNPQKASGYRTKLNELDIPELHKELMFMPKQQRMEKIDSLRVYDNDRYQALMDYNEGKNGARPFFNKKKHNYVWEELIEDTKDPKAWADFLSFADMNGRNAALSHLEKEWPILHAQVKLELENRRDEARRKRVRKELAENILDIHKRNMDFSQLEIPFHLSTVFDNKGSEIDVSRIEESVIKDQPVAPIVPDKSVREIIEEFCQDRLENKGKNIEQIGKGGDGTVYKFQNWAIKVYNDLDIRGLEVIEKIQDAPHPHIIQSTFDVVDDVFYEIMPYYEHGNLGDHLALFLNEEDIMEVYDQLKSAVEHLHELKIQHRDLKTGNVLVESLMPLKLRVTDFGRSRENANSLSMTRSVGTFLYMSPDSLAGNPQYACDYYALGIVMAQVASRGKKTFANEGHLVDSTLNWDAFKSCSGKVKRLIRRLTNKNAKKRMKTGGFWANLWDYLCN